MKRNNPPPKREHLACHLATSPQLGRKLTVTLQGPWIPECQVCSLGPFILRGRESLPICLSVCLLILAAEYSVHSSSTGSQQTVADTNY